MAASLEPEDIEARLLLIEGAIAELAELVTLSIGARTWRPSITAVHAAVKERVAAEADVARLARLDAERAKLAEKVGAAR